MNLRPLYPQIDTLSMKSQETTINYASNKGKTRMAEKAAGTYIVMRFSHESNLKNKKLISRHSFLYLFLIKVKTDLLRIPRLHPT